MKFSKEIIINHHVINEESPVYIIGEAGVNHNGDMSLARELIDIACEAGVDAVKFQAFQTEGVILPSVEKAPYQKRTTNRTESQYEMLKKLEINYEQDCELKEYCEQKHITFLSTPSEEKSLETLVQVGVPALKIASTDLTNIKFLRQAAEYGMPLLLSAGMSYLEEIRLALQAISAINPNVVLLQCTANYPIKDEEANLRAIQSLKEEFDILVGYSDHSVGIGAAPFAVSAGAKVIEKHFTIDKSMEGPDHKASVTPEELKKLVQEIRRAEVYMGSRIKIPTLSELGTRRSLQKCLVAARPILSGEKFTADNLTAKRTNGEGISALYYDLAVGKTADRNYTENQIIKL